MHPEGLADLLVPVQRAALEGGEELPRLGVTEDVDQVRKYSAFWSA
jgi:hypothetical protein